MNTFEVHLCSKKKILVSQDHFRSTYQAETQTIADYIATLRYDIIDGEFTSPCGCHVSIADIFLRAQFELSKGYMYITLVSADKEVSKVFKYRNTKGDDGNAQNRNCSTSRPRVKLQQRSKSQSRINLENLGIKNLCICCGRDINTMKECNTEHSSLKCSACKRSGHDNEVCIRPLLDVKRKVRLALQNQSLQSMSAIKELLIIMG
jgi:hypothetical protein